MFAFGEKIKMNIKETHKPTNLKNSLYQEKNRERILPYLKREMPTDPTLYENPWHLPEHKTDILTLICSPDTQNFPHYERIGIDLINLTKMLNQGGLKV
jgi:hypothetical protein